MKHTRSRAEMIGRRIAALVGLTLALAAFALPGNVAFAAMRLKHTPTPPPGPAPVFAIDAPLFGANKNIPEGPVGTYVRVKADANSGWTPNATVTLSVLPSDGDCAMGGGVPVTTKQPITVGGDQSFIAVFAWPQAASQGPNYSICATESGAGTQVGKTKNTFILLSPNLPTINVSPISVPLGGTVQVTGTNFLPVDTIKLFLQHPNNSFKDDPGDSIPTTNLQPQGDGSFSVSVKLPSDRTSSNVIVAVIGANYYQENGFYPVTASSQPLTFTAVTPTPQVTPTVAPTVSVGTTTSTDTTNNNGLLIVLLGVIAVVLLLAGVIVAVLALRGRSTPPDAGPTDRRPSGPGGYGGYIGDGPLDQTIADADWQGQGRNWDEDDRWQSPAGRPWSGGRASTPYDGRNAPPSRGPMDDEDDDRFRTRMGDPYQSAPPPPARPNYPPPQSRPMGPPQSRPMPPRSNPRPQNPNPNWNNGDNGGQEPGPAPWPPRQ